MHYGTVPGLEKRVSRLVQGTMPINGKDESVAFGLLDAVLEQGGNAFDTAHIYGGGECERIFGRWMKARGVREKVVILAKGAHHNSDRRRVTPFDIAADLHDSLARMQTDYVDLYVLHRDDPNVPVGPIVEALNEWKRAGKIVAFGGSNWSYQRLQEANDYAAAHGLTPFVASSPNFSLARQDREPWAECVTLSGPENAEARAWYERTQMAVFSWSSLAAGFFSGRMTRENLGTWDDYFMKLSAQCYGTDDNFERLDRVTQLAADKCVTIPQIAVAWVMSQPLNLFALVGCRTGEEFAANAAALEITLTPRERDWLDLKADTPR